MKPSPTTLEALRHGRKVRVEWFVIGALFSGGSEHLSHNIPLLYLPSWVAVVPMLIATWVFLKMLRKYSTTIRKIETME